MTAWMRSNSSALLADDEAHHLSLADGVDQAADVVRARQAQERGGLDLGLEPGHELPQEAAEVAAQPGHPLELERVGRLVDRHPAQELGLGQRVRARHLANVRRDDQQARGARRRVGLEQI
jgi:hypothetical protein